MSEEVVVPLRWCCGPGHFQTAGDGIAGNAAAVLAAPAETLRLEIRSLGVCTHEGGIAGTMSLAEGMPAGDQRNSLFIVHCHALECFADVSGGSQGIRLAVWAFRIDVNQAHLYGTERIFEFAIPGVANIAS